MSYISINNLSFSYDDKNQVLNNLNIDIEKGDWVAILGHNGSGKSTLAKIIVGLLEANEGTVSVDEVELNEETAYELRKKIGIVFQNPDNQFVGVTVKDDIAFGMENLCFPREEMIKNIEFYADKVNMTQYLNKEPSNLSGGQKQRVAIAGILAMQTEIIIFDEATSMLDPYGRDDLIKYIKSLHKDGFTIIMITHDINEALLADKLLILNKGSIVTYGPLKEVLLDEKAFTESHLELPLSVKVMNTLKNDSSMQEVRDLLWEYTLKK
jgi:energy-coupling factor transport system ATP-binding protein